MLGQPGFTTIAAGSGPAQLTAPQYIAYDAQQRLFVDDTLNNRVVVFDLSGSITNGMPATWVIGQPNLTSSGGCGAGATTASTLCQPHGVLYDAAAKLLFIADGGDTRILIWDLNATPFDWTATALRGADYVIGQPDMVSNPFNRPAPVSASDLTMPNGLAWDTTDPANRKLYVTDTVANRVLTFKIPNPLNSTVNHEAAVNVAGQPDYASIAPGTSSQNLHNPTGLSFDRSSGNLYLSDRDNNRTLVFDTKGTTTGTPWTDGMVHMAATWVLGQPDLATTTASTGPDGFTSPTIGNYDAASSIYFQSDFRRVLLFNNLSGASIVLGQPNFTSQAFGWSQSQLVDPWGSAYDSAGKRLFVVDNNRIMVFPEDDSCGPPVCSATNMICGRVTAAEDGTALQNAVVELRDGGGAFKQSSKTAADGTYSFASLSAGSTYYVTAAVGRTESVTPSSVPVAPLHTRGAVADLQIRGWPGTFQVSGTPGSYILISNASYTGPNAPANVPSASFSTGNYAGVIGSDGETTVLAPKGSSYYLTCWVARESGAMMSFTRTPSSNSFGPYSVAPGGNTPGLSCLQ